MTDAIAGSEILVSCRIGLMIYSNSGIALEGAGHKVVLVREGREQASEETKGRVIGIFYFRSPLDSKNYCACWCP